MGNLTITEMIEAMSGWQAVMVILLIAAGLSFLLNVIYYICYTRFKSG